MCRVGNIVNVTKEIDNFFPGIFNYCNVRVTDEETTDLMKHWQQTYSFITKAKSVKLVNVFLILRYSTFDENRTIVPP